MTSPRGGVVIRKTTSLAIRNVPSASSGGAGTGNGNSTEPWVSSAPGCRLRWVSSDSCRAAAYRKTTRRLLTTSTWFRSPRDLAVRSVRVVAKPSLIRPLAPVMPRLRSVRVGSSTSISRCAVVCTFAMRAGSVRIVTVTPERHTGRPRQVCW